MISLVRDVLAICILPISLSLAAPASAAIPFFNASCPGGLDIHADAGGPVYVDGRETTLKRFSETYYEARDKQTGTTLSISSNDGTPQVSYTGRGGANGVCQLGPAPTSREHRRETRARDDRAGGSTEVTCESTDRKQVECDMDTRGDVRVVRQLSRTSCRQNENWGLSRHSVWVKDGCRAVFRNTSRSQDRPQAGRTDDRALGACNTRKGANGALVTQMPVGTDYNELIIDYPDGRFLCMLRNDGMVQSLTRLRGR